MLFLWAEKLLVVVELTILKIVKPIEYNRKKNNNIAGRNVEKFILLIKDKYIKDFGCIYIYGENAKVKRLR